MRLLKKFFRPEYFYIAAFLSILASCGSISTLMIEPVNAHHVFWSPDGNKVAIIFVVDGRDHEIFVADSNGRNLQRIASEGDGWIERIRWSPDSENFYYWMPPLQPFSTPYRIDLDISGFGLNLLGDNTISANDYPVATEAEIDESVASTSNDFYAISVCNNPTVSDDYFELQNCWHNLEVYSVETGEMVWSIGRYRYRMARFGLLRTLDSIELLMVSAVLFVLGIVSSISGLIKRNPDSRKQKEK